MADLQSAAL